MPLPATLDGELHEDAATIQVAATDDGLLRGDGAFEVIRVYAGRPFTLTRHLDRLRGTLAAIRLEADIDAVGDDIARLLAARPGFDGPIRVVITRGGRRIVILEPLPRRGEAVRLGSVTYAPPRLLDGTKTLSYAANMLATRLAQERGFDDALLVTPHGRVLEAPTAAFFWGARGVLRTPPLDDHILASITRAVVMEEVDVEEGPCGPEDLAGAEEAFVASSLRQVLPVAAVDDRPLTTPGPLTRAAARALEARIAAETAAGATG